MFLIDKIKYNIERNNFKKSLTNNLGKIEETDDNIICYVKNKL